MRCSFLRIKAIAATLFCLPVFTGGMPGETIYGSPIKDLPQRQRISLNQNWLYLEEEIANVQDVLGPQHEWTRIDLPHTWNLHDAVDPVPGYRRSSSWYRKELHVPALKNRLRLVLSFEGVNITSEVFVNGSPAGVHVGGYVGFDIDITPLIRQGTSNTILVRVSNAYDPDVIPSQKSDFCIYGGITRDVWLEVLPEFSISQLKLLTPAVSASQAELRADIIISSPTGRQDPIDAEITVLAPDGHEVGKQTVTVEPGRDTVSAPLITIRNPALWSPDNPSLYSARVRLTRGQMVIDETEDRFGCRWFEFKPHGPFYLNGKRLLLRGTHRHEDFAGYANAMPDSLHRCDIRMIKEMGANFVRLAHYPQDPEVYRACDELGIIVWDELPWCRGGMGGERWKANTRRLLAEQIRRYYNHPSIFVRSLGNEFNWLPDFPGGDNIDSLRLFLRDLNSIAHRLDPGRLTATRKFTEGADLVDVVSPSLWPGWYSGYYRGFEKALTDSRDRFPRFFHAEYGGDSHVGRHNESPVTGDGESESWEEQITPQKVKNVSLSSDWSENYIVDLFDWYLHISERLDWFSGNAQWAFKDFPTPLRPENPIPYMNQKGLVDRAGKPKDAYYVFKSYWTTKPLFCYIESHTWTERAGPKDLKRELNVYSNCSEAELWLNGVSLGRKERSPASFPACGLSWRVNFSEGRNFLRVKGFARGKEAAEDTLSVNYSFTRNDVADHLELSAEPRETGTILVTALAVDKNGRRALDYNRRIYFALTGQGQKPECVGTPNGSPVIEMANGRATWEIPAPAGGAVVIEARNQDFKGVYLVVGTDGLTR